MNAFVPCRRVRNNLIIGGILLGCGASAQIVSSCHGVSEQYCIIYKKTHDKLCILLKYNLPAPRAVTLLFADSAQILLSAPSGVRTLIPKRRKQSFFSKIFPHGIRTHVSQTEQCLSYQSTICALLHLYML